MNDYFELFNNLHSAMERRLGRSVRKSEHNSLFINYIRVKIGLEPNFEKSVPRQVGSANRGNGPLAMSHVKIIELRKAGKMRKEIAEILGCNIGTIGKVLKRNGLVTRGRGLV